jgi:hypothetical protein
MAIRLLNTPRNILDSIESLGTDRLFQIIQNCGEEPGCFEEVQLGDTTRIEKTKNCLQAHKLLMKLDPANVDKFRDVTAFLAEDVRRQETSVQ